MIPGETTSLGLDLLLEDLERKEEDQDPAELARFGADLFKEISTFAPVDNAPVPEGYRLGVGDELLVTLFWQATRRNSTTDRPRWKYNIPQVGKIPLAGLSFDQASNLIEAKVSETLIGVSAITTMGDLGV